MGLNRGEVDGLGRSRGRGKSGLCLIECNNKRRRISVKYVVRSEFHTYDREEGRWWWWWLGTGTVWKRREEWGGVLSTKLLLLRE